MNIARSTSVVFITKLLSGILTLVAVAFFARHLGPGELGVFFLFRAAVSLLGIPADFGLGIAIEKRISEGDNQSTVASSGLALKSLLLLITVIPVFIFQDIVDGYIGAELTVFLIIALLFHHLSHLMVKILKGELRVAESAIVSFSQTVVWVGLGTILVIYNYGATGLAASLAVGYFVKFTFGLALQNTGFSMPSFDTAKSLVQYASYSSIAVVDGTLHSSMDILIIGLFLTSEAVGVYETAWQIGVPILLLANSIGSTIFPQISSWDASDSHGKIEDLISKTITPSMIVVIPAVFGGALLAEEILSLIYGPEFAAGAAALVVIVAGKIPRSLRTIFGRTLLGINKPKLVAIGGVVDIVLNIVLNLVLIYYFGILGAAFGTMLSMTAGTGVRMYFLSRFIKIRIPYLELLWCTVAAIGMYAVIYILKISIEINTVPILFGVIGFGAIVYFLLVLVYSPIRTRYLPNKIKSILK